MKIIALNINVQFFFSKSILSYSNLWSILAFDISFVCAMPKDGDARKKKEEPKVCLRRN
jgi:hypothetical protein